LDVLIRVSLACGLHDFKLTLLVLNGFADLVRFLQETGLLLLTNLGQGLEFSVHLLLGGDSGQRLLGAFGKDAKRLGNLLAGDFSAGGCVATGELCWGLYGLRRWLYGASAVGATGSVGP
jgi:hypothetical protein